MKAVQLGVPADRLRRRLNFDVRRLHFRDLSMEIVEGQEFWGILAELCIDSETNRRRVRTLPGQSIPAGLFVECSMKVREDHALKTIFKVNVGVSRKPTGRLYLHSLRKAELLTVPEWGTIYG